MRSPIETPNTNPKYFKKKKPGQKTRSFLPFSIRKTTPICLLATLILNPNNFAGHTGENSFTCGPGKGVIFSGNRAAHQLLAMVERCRRGKKLGMGMTPLESPDLPPLKLTYKQTHLKMGRNPKGKLIRIPTIHFQGRC